MRVGPPSRSALVRRLSNSTQRHGRGASSIRPRLTIRSLSELTCKLPALPVASALAPSVPFATFWKVERDVTHFSLGPAHIVVLTHPDDIRDVLVTNKRNFVKGRGLQRSKRLLGEGLLTSEGSFHLRQRRLAQPAFHRERIAGYADVMASYAEKAREQWTSGETIDVGREMNALTLAIAGKTLLNAEVGGDTRAIGDALTEVMRLFNLAMLPFAEYFDRLPLPWNVRFERAKATLDEIIYRVIAERRASGEDRGDLLSMLMIAQDAEGDGGARIQWTRSGKFWNRICDL